MSTVWDEMYRAATTVLRPRTVSTTVEVGGVAAAVESDCGNVYVGVCVDTACTLGVCAERNAIFSMLTDGGDSIRRVLAVRDGRAIPPCGACRELMAQLMPDGYASVEIMMDYKHMRIVTLGDLTPLWWI